MDRRSLLAGTIVMFGGTALVMIGGGLVLPLFEHGALNPADAIGTAIGAFSGGALAARRNPRGDIAGHVPAAFTVVTVTLTCVAICNMLLAPESDRSVDVVAGKLLYAAMFIVWWLVPCLVLFLWLLERWLWGGRSRQRRART